jgi:UDP-N-acetylglucosamine acyltransferase
MKNHIDPTAIIGDNVSLGENNTIGAFVVIKGNISIGNNNVIGDFSRIVNNVEIGDQNRIEGYASIGSLGEMGTKGDSFVADGKVSIGNNNVLREFITINSPVRKKATLIGNNCYFMARTHVPHDAEIGNNVVMATNSLVGGGCVVHDFAYIGLNSSVHQWVDLGESCMVGLQAAVTRPVPPYCIVTGMPARIMKLNEVGLQRRGFSDSIIEEAKESLQLAIKMEYSGDNLILQKISEFISKHPDSLPK